MFFSPKHKPGPEISAAIFSLLLLASCTGAGAAFTDEVIHPIVVTDKLPHDTDDPAIWIDSLHPERSLILGTDKDTNGGLYVFDLNGKIDSSRSVRGLHRPNNVDVEYGLKLGGKTVDIAVVTERLTHKLRVYTLPDLKPIDNGGLDMFVGQTQEGYRDLMGIGLYRDPSGSIFAVVGRKTGPKDGTYLWQYLLEDDGTGHVQSKLVRKFGQFSGKKEIESIMVDDKAGYVYYSDEGVGIRKYHADTAKGNSELAVFGTKDFSLDHEGISIYETSDSTGFILVSDQGSNRFHIFPREGSAGNKHDHPDLKSVRVLASESDGSDVTSLPLGKKFPGGVFVVMSTDLTFHYYQPEKILGDSLLADKHGH